MNARKWITIITAIALILTMVGCISSSKIIGNILENDKEALSSPVIHEVYSNTEDTEAKVVSVYNTNGNIKISQSKNNKMMVNVQLVQTKDIDDLDKKLENLIIKPQILGNIVFFEPSYSGNTNMNYWDWIQKNANANGIQVDFDIQIPTTVQEIRLYSDVGNISIDDITAKIHAQTEVGNIIGSGITPLDMAIFLSNVPSSETGINLSFNSFERVNAITTGVSVGVISISVPSGEKYNHKQIDDLQYHYENDMYFDNKFIYCKEKCLEKFKGIAIKLGKTTIITPKNDIVHNVKIK